MQYSPEAQQLKCIYCEAEQPIPHVDGEIIENDYEEWVERETRAPFYTQGAQNQKVSVTEVEEHGGDAMYEVTCKQCGATTTFDPHVQSQRCPFCDSPLEKASGLLPMRRARVRSGVSVLVGSTFLSGPTMRR